MDMGYPTKNEVLLYISAAADLGPERDLLGRAVTEVPVTLGWRVVQSPTGDQPVDREAVAGADLHLLLLGGDIRAPIGQEWLAARRAGRLPVLLLKQGVPRTLAAQDFERFVAKQAPWQPFREGKGLRRHVLRLLGRHLLAQATLYGLSPVERERLRVWHAGLAGSQAPGEPETRGGAGESGVVLSPERYVPSEGVLIRPEDGQD
jgi:hypothetical protein